MSINKNEILITEFLEYLLHNRKFSNHTIRSYKNDLSQFNIFLKSYDDSLTDFSKIDKTAIQFYIQKCSKEGASDKTLLRKVSSIKSFYRYLTQFNIVDYNIATLISSPKVSKRIPHYLSKKQIEKLMKLPDLSTFQGIMNNSILEIFYSTGIRISELIRIKIKDINLNKQIIKVMGKGKRERIVILGENACDAIKNYLRVNKNSNNIYLYPSINNDSSHVSMSYIYKMVKSYLIKVSNDEKLSPHSLRHSFATHLLDNGADLMSVKDLLGHKDLSSTQVYTHVTIEKMKEIYKQAHPHGNK